MSREKECECCHEWWYASDIKEDLCPNCYDYFKQIKQELKVALSVRQKDLAIQMLEEVKEWLNEPFDENGCFKIGGDLIDFIDQQISNLRG